MTSDKKEKMMLISNKFSHFSIKHVFWHSLELPHRSFLMGCNNLYFNGTVKKIFQVLIRYNLLSELKVI